MRAFLKEILFLIGAVLILCFEIYYLQNNHLESKLNLINKSFSLAEKLILSKTNSLDKLIINEKARQESFFNYQKAVKQSLEPNFLADALDYQLKDINPLFKQSSELFLLESSYLDLNPRLIELLKDIAKHKERFSLTKQAGFEYHCYQISFEQNKFTLVLKLKEASLFDLLSLEFYLSFFVLALIFLNLINKRATKQTQAKSFIKTIVFFSFCFILMALETSKSQQSIFSQRQSIRNYQQEIDILNSKNITKLNLSYRQVRSLLPFLEEGIYNVISQKQRFIFQAKNKQILGITSQLDRNFKQKSGFLFVLFLLFCLSLYIAYLKNLTSLNQLSEKLVSLYKNKNPELKHNYESDRLMQELDNLIQDIFLSVKEREFKQRLMTKELYLSLAKSFKNQAELEVQELNAVCLLLKPLNIESLNNLAAKDWYLYLNKYITTIREIAKKNNAIIFFEDGFNLALLFCEQEFNAVLVQRAIICGLESIKQTKHNFQSIDLNNNLSASIFSDKFSLKLAETRFREEILIGGPLVQKLDFELNNQKNSGVILAQELFKQYNYLLFNLDKIDEQYLKIIGVKNLSDHLSLLSTPSEELQKTALDLASLKLDINTLKEVINNLENFSEEPLKKALLVLKDYCLADIGVSLILDTINQWLIDENNFKKDLALRLYAELPLTLADSDLEKILTYIKKSNSKNLVKLVIRHYNGTYREEWQSLFDDSDLITRAEWSLLCFLRFNMLSGLDGLLDCLNLASKDEKLIILAFFNQLIDKKAEFKQWYLEGGQKLASFLALTLHGSDRRSIFLVLQVIGNLDLKDFFDILLIKCEKSLDSEMKKEILETLKRLGADAFLTTGVSYAIS